MVVLRLTLSCLRKVSRSSRTRTSRSTVTCQTISASPEPCQGIKHTSSNRSTSHLAISPMQSWTRRLSPSEICIMTNNSQRQAKLRGARLLPGASAKTNRHPKYPRDYCGAPCRIHPQRPQSPITAKLRYRYVPQDSSP
jgi:hypothetical protein